MKIIESQKEILLDKVYNIDCREGLKLLKEKSIQTCITSPPYWGMRNYNTNPLVYDDFIVKCQHEFEEIYQIHNSILKENSQYICKKCGAWKGELGSEKDYNLYIKHLCDIFDQVRYVLKDDGTIYVNLADTYSSGGGDTLGSCCDVKKKSLCMIPQRFAIEMINRGWILRNTIIWHKPNAMPSPTKDRFTNDFEYIFFFSKCQKYYFLQQLEPYTTEINRWSGNDCKDNDNSNYDKLIGQKRIRDRKIRPNENGKNKRCVWSVNTQSSQDKHCAVFPEKLIETPILASCPENEIVLDIFSGSGTTKKVCNKLGRKFIGFEIDNKMFE